MIYCKKTDLTQYLGITDRLDTAICFIQNLLPNALSMGRNEIDGEEVYVNRFDYETKPQNELLFESHHRYVDVHLLLSGEERILCASVGELTQVEVDAAADYVGLRGCEQASFHMTDEDVLIVFPHEAHKVKCIAEATSRVQKAVIKVAFSRQNMKTTAI